MLNHITIMGRLVRDPEMRTTQSGVAVASFTLAVDRDFGGRDGGEKQTDFIDCTAWRHTAEFVSKYFSKGRMAVVSGRLQIDNYTDNDGVKHYSDQVIVNAFEFCESKAAAASGSAPTEYSTSPAKTDDDGFMHVPEGIDYDLPFV